MNTPPPRSRRRPGVARAPAASTSSADVPPLHGKATINDIARLTGVSKKTVSRVINQSPLVHPETRAKVLALMQQVGYVPDPQARGLAFRRSFLVGLVFDNPTAQYIVDMQYGALDALRDSGYELIVHPCDSSHEDYVDRVCRFARQQKLHGVILVPPVSENDRLAETLRQIGVRCVRVASIPLDTDAGMIVTRDRIGGAAVADHIVSLGHRVIGLITGPRRYRSTVERESGFLDTLAAHGIGVPPGLVFEGSYTFASGVAGAERLLARSPRPTAIFACNDEMAAGVYKAAMLRGLSIPGDLSVVGYDDSPLASQLWPALTTARVPTRDLGRQAAQMLLGAPGLQADASSDVAPRLIVRDSSQPPR